LILALDLSTVWGQAFYLLAQRLREKLGHLLVSLVAMPDEGSMAYESNVLVVLKKAGVEEIRKVLRVKVELMFGDKVNISPFITTPDDEVVERYINLATRSGEILPDLWKEAISSFKGRIKKELGDLLIGVKAPDEGSMAYESNVLVVLKKAGVEEIRKVLRVRK